MSKISQIIRMIQLLNAGKKFSIRDLADELDISERMVRHYKNELEVAGIYITTIKGRYGGYVLDNKFILPAVKINNKDIEVLSSMKSEKIKPLLNKLKVIVDEYDFNKIDTYSDKFKTFQKAIKNKQKMLITYKSLNLGNVKRTIQPIEMFSFSKGWFVVAFCELRQDMRNFEFDSILEYKILQENF